MKMSRRERRIKVKSAVACIRVLRGLKHYENEKKAFYIRGVQIDCGFKVTGK